MASVTNLQAQIDALGERVSDAADVAEVTAGTVGNKYVSPATLKAVYGGAKDTVLDTRTGKLVHVRSELSSVSKFQFALQMRFDAATSGYYRYGFCAYGIDNVAVCVYNDVASRLYLAIEDTSYTGRGGKLYKLSSPQPSSILNVPTSFQQIYAKGYTGTNSYYIYFQISNIHTLCSINSGIVILYSYAKDNNIQAVIYNTTTDVSIATNIDISGTRGISCIFETTTYHGYVYTDSNAKTATLYYNVRSSTASKTANLPVPNTGYFSFNMLGIYENTIWIRVGYSSSQTQVYKIDLSSGAPIVTAIQTFIQNGVYVPLFVRDQYTYFVRNVSGNTWYSKVEKLNLVTGALTSQATTSGTFQDSTSMNITYMGSIDNTAYLMYNTDVLYKIDTLTDTISFTYLDTKAPYAIQSALTGGMWRTHDHPKLGKCLLIGRYVIYPDTARVITIPDTVYSVTHIGSKLANDNFIGYSSLTNYSSGENLYKYSLMSGSTAHFTAMVDY